ncbi:hypothetical protein B0H17DRAFT_1121370, partial [Mycena rosella]
QAHAAAAGPAQLRGEAVPEACVFGALARGGGLGGRRRRDRGVQGGLRAREGRGTATMSGGGDIESAEYVEVGLYSGDEVGSVDDALEYDNDPGATAVIGIMMHSSVERGTLTSGSGMVRPRPRPTPAAGLKISTGQISTPSTEFFCNNGSVEAKMRRGRRHTSIERDGDEIDVLRPTQRFFLAAISRLWGLVTPRPMLDFPPVGVWGVEGHSKYCEEARRSEYVILALDGSERDPGLRRPISDSSWGLAAGDRKKVWGEATE